jgi:hypothetical protein
MSTNDVVANDSSNRFTIGLQIRRVGINKLTLEQEELFYNQATSLIVSFVARTRFLSLSLDDELCREDALQTDECECRRGSVHCE